jgi:hypothetical protein
MFGSCAEVPSRKNAAALEAAGVDGCKKQHAQYTAGRRRRARAEMRGTAIPLGYRGYYFNSRL